MSSLLEQTLRLPQQLLIKVKTIYENSFPFDVSVFGGAVIIAHLAGLGSVQTQQIEGIKAVADSWKGHS